MRQSLYDYCIENKRGDLLREWDAEANLPLTPETVTSGSHRDIRWVCDKGHRWTAKPYARTAARSRCPVCAGKKILPGVNDLRTLAPDVAAEWDAEKNGTLRPEDISPNSARRVWWKCRACGWKWEASVKSRAGAQKTGCPVCAGRRILPGVNDLATLAPDVAAEWDAEKNGTLRPKDVSPNSARKVWWKCGVCGCGWQAAVSSRAGTQKTGCPVCAGKVVLPGVNDLASRYPDVAAQWHPTKNGRLTPDAVTPQSNQTVWWRCEKGHDYRTTVALRMARGDGCPYCANRKVLPGFNDLGTLAPEVAAEWHPSRNGALTPQDVTCGSVKKVWWKCHVCGYEWKAVVYSRASSHRCGCPFCAGKVKISKRRQI